MLAAAASRLPARERASKFLLGIDRSACKLLLYSIYIYIYIYAVLACSLAPYRNTRWPLGNVSPFQIACTDGDGDGDGDAGTLHQEALTRPPGAQAAR